MDTTGAGDAYIGAFAAKFSEKDQTEDGLRKLMEFATMTALLTITRVGAAEAIPCLDEVE